MSIKPPNRVVRVDDLRGRGLVAWLVLVPLATIVLVAAIVMRPSRDASCNAALPCEEDLATTGATE
jgi:hypothetical protein